MPYEEITKEEYFKRYSKMPDLTNLASIVNKYEEEYEEYELEEACSTGQCPVR